MKGFPKLERWSDLVEDHLDEGHLTTAHCNYGSKDRPCPDWNRLAGVSLGLALHLVF